MTDREQQRRGDSGHVVPPDLERTLTWVARAMLRLGVPEGALAPGDSIDRAGYWLLVRVSEHAPIRLSELAEAAGLDLSTVSREARDLVAAGLMTKVPDPEDGRAALVGLSDRGAAVLTAVSEAPRQVLDEAVAEWTDDERAALAGGLVRLGEGLRQGLRGDEGTG